MKIGDKITFNVGTRQTSDGYDLNGNNPYIDDTEESLVNVEEKSIYYSWRNRKMEL